MKRSFTCSISVTQETVDKVRRWFDRMLAADCQIGDTFIGPNGVVWHRLEEGEIIPDSIWIKWHWEGEEANPEWWFTFHAKVEDMVRLWLEKALANAEKRVRTDYVCEVGTKKQKPTETLRGPPNGPTATSLKMWKGRTWRPKRTEMDGEGKASKSWMGSR